MNILRSIHHANQPEVNLRMMMGWVILGDHRVGDDGVGGVDGGDGVGADGG